MKLLFTLLIAFLIVQKSQSQNVGIGTSDPKARLDIAATNEGVLIPRVALTATNVSTPLTTPETSELVYNTATAGTPPNNVVPGYYYWNGSNWVAFGGSGGRDWGLTGNAGTTASTAAIGNAVNNNFIGTTDNTSFVLATNNFERLRIAEDGNVGIGTITPKDLLQIGSLYAFHNGGQKGFAYNGYFDGSNWKYLQNGYWSGIFNSSTGDINMYLGATGTAGSDVTGISPGIHILNNGNVGIGDYSPSVRLDVNGSLRIRSAGDAAGNIRFDAANPYITSGGSYIHVKNGFYLYDAAQPSYTEAVFNFRNAILNDGGNFGGNLRVQDNLEVTGDLAFFGMTANNRGILLEATNTSFSTIRGENDIRFNIGNGVYPGTTWPEVMRITRSSRVGIGTDNPDHILHVKGSPVRFEKDAHAAGSDNYSLELFSPQGGSAGEISIRFHQSGRFYQQIRCRPGLFRFTAGNNDTGIDIYAAGFVTTSDDRVKSDKMNLEYGLKEIVSLKPMRYKQHSYTFENNKLELLEDSKKDIGLIAQEVYELIPEAVLKPEDERKDIWAMNYPKLIPVLIKAIQEQQTQIDKLEKENNGLKSVNNTVDKKYNELKAALEKLESYIYSEAKK